jgi:hypothetical protein
MLIFFFFLNRTFRSLHVFDNANMTRKAVIVTTTNPHSTLKRILQHLLFHILILSQLVSELFSSCITSGQVGNSLTKED